MNRVKQRPYIERRDSDRTTMLKGAVVKRNGGGEPVACVIANGSLGGCELVAPHIEELPAEIRIDVEGFAKPLYGRIVRRRKGRVGVQLMWEHA